MSYRERGTLPDETERFFSAGNFDFCLFFDFVCFGRAQTPFFFSGELVLLLCNFGRSDIAERITCERSIVDLRSSTLTYFLNFENF